MKKYDESSEFVTKGYLRAELAELKYELKTEINWAETKLENKINTLENKLFFKMGGTMTFLFTVYGFINHLLK